MGRSGSLELGPQVTGTEELARRIRNPELDVRGMELFRSFNVLDQLPHICCPTLVCVGRARSRHPSGRRPRDRRRASRWNCSLRLERRP
jgi:hypothetical protein